MVGVAREGNLRGIFIFSLFFKFIFSLFFLWVWLDRNDVMVGVAGGLGLQGIVGNLGGKFGGF